jgi:SAM-dependent methyltransferase
VNVDKQLLDEDTLATSAVVANCAMNRERQLLGPNSYEKELRFNPLDRLRAGLADKESVGWLDLCCGSGRALIQAAHRLRDSGLADRVTVVGLDLVDHFDPTPAPSPPLRLVCSGINRWTPAERFDLITCIHGLHYVGDKLAALARAASWLTDDGLLIADLDAASIRVPAGRSVAGVLRESGFTYDARRHRITCEGRRDVTFPYAYLGADDQAGPNYTGQAAVNSHYRSIAP